MLLCLRNERVLKKERGKAFFWNVMDVIFGTDLIESFLSDFWHEELWRILANNFECWAENRNPRSSFNNSWFFFVLNYNNRGFTVLEKNYTRQELVTQKKVFHLLIFQPFWPESVFFEKPWKLRPKFFNILDSWSWKSFRLYQNSSDLWIAVYFSVKLAVASGFY